MEKKHKYIAVFCLFPYEITFFFCLLLMASLFSSASRHWVGSHEAHHFQSSLKGGFYQKRAHNCTYISEKNTFKKKKNDIKLLLTLEDLPERGVGCWQP